jgi:hypothetical protein
MTFRRTLTGTIGALALMAAIATPTLATPVTPSDSTDVDIVVTSTGVLSVEVAETEAFDDVTYSFDDKHSVGELTVTVTDLRGSAAGWKFNLRANGDFDGAHTNDTIPVNGLGLAFNYEQRVAGNPDLTGVTGTTILHVSTSGQQIANATTGFGNGEYDIVFAGDLLVPGDTLVDTYTTTLTVEAASAP